MIIIKECSLLDRHLLWNYTVKVKGNHSQMLKAHKLSEACFFCLLAYDHIFMTDSVFILHIISRFI